MISLRNQNANENDNVEDNIQEDDPMSELEEDGDDDDHPKAAKSNVAKRSTQKGVPAAKRQPKKSTKPMITGPETESEEDEPPITKKSKKTVIADPETESEEDEPPITKKRKLAKNAPKKRAIAPPETESEQDEPPITKKRRVDKEKTTAPMNVRKVRLTLPKPVETEKNHEVNDGEEVC